MMTQCFLLRDGTLWSQKDEIPDDIDHLVPLGVADVKREGKDITIVAIGGAVPLAIKAAMIVEADGISVEVVDPRTLGATGLRNNS